MMAKIIEGSRAIYFAYAENTYSGIRRRLKILIAIAKRRLKLFRKIKDNKRYSIEETDTNELEKKQQNYRNLLMHSKKD